MSHAAKIASFFDARATDGAAARREALLGDVAEQVLTAMEVRPGQQLVDAGCGVGWATKLLGKKAPGAQAVGIDLSPQMVAVADAATDWTSRARFECMPVEAIDFPDGKFDHAFSLEAIDYVPDPEAALRELARVLKPGSSLELVIRRFTGSPATEGWAEVLGVELPWLDETGWGSAVAAAGFELQSATTLQDRRDFVPFEATPLTPDEDTHRALIAAGVHWIRAQRP